MLMVPDGIFTRLVWCAIFSMNSYDNPKAVLFLSGKSKVKAPTSAMHDQWCQPAHRKLPHAQTKQLCLMQQAFEDTTPVEYASKGPEA